MKTRSKSMKNSLALTAFLSAVASFVSPFEVSAQTIYSHSNDGMIEVRDTLPPTNPWPQIHPGNGNDFAMNVGEWFGQGLTTAVMPFELPNFGAVANPFTSADLGVMVHTKGNATVTDVDLYGVRVNASPDLLLSDWYLGSNFDPNSTLIQASFLTPASPAGFVGAPNNFTDATGDANLLAFLNQSYAGGANAGQFVFLRLSYGADTFASGWDAYQLTTRNAGQQGEWPVITYTAIPEPSVMGLGALASVLLACRRRRNAGLI